MFSLRKRKKQPKPRKSILPVLHSFSFSIPTPWLQSHEKRVRYHLSKGETENKLGKSGTQVSSSQFLPLEGEEYNPVLGFPVFRE